jgi:hypothetical protein
MEVDLIPARKTRMLPQRQEEMLYSCWTRSPGTTLLHTQMLSIAAKLVLQHNIIFQEKHSGL